ncbi:MAG: hypothetical protein RL670_370 [Actinomycetota bacterium]
MASGIEVLGVITRTDAEVGRKRVLTPSAVAKVANELGLRIHKTNQIDPETLEWCRKLNADLGVVVAYGAIFKPEMLDVPRRGWINLHYSLLPRWRGAAPVQHSILAGDRETGVTAFQLDAGMDTGPIWSQAHTVIEPHESAGSLLVRLTQLGISCLLEAMPKVLAGIEQPLVQSNEGATSASKPTRDLARVHFDRDAANVENLIRAMNPEPMSWALWRDEPIQLLEAVSLGSTDWANLGTATDHTVPGSVVLVNERVMVQTGAGTLIEVKQVKPAGKQAMDARDWCRGFNRESDWLLR